MSSKSTWRNTILTSSYSRCKFYVVTILTTDLIVVSFTTRENLVKVNTFMLLKSLHNYPCLVPLSAIMFFLQPVDPLIMQSLLAFRQFNQIPCLVLHKRLHLIIHNKLPLDLIFHLQSLLITLELTTVSQ